MSASHCHELQSAPVNVQTLRCKHEEWRGNTWQRSPLRQSSITFSVTVSSALVLSWQFSPWIISAEWDNWLHVWIGVDERQSGMAVSNSNVKREGNAGCSLWHQCNGKSVHWRVLSQRNSEQRRQVSMEGELHNSALKMRSLRCKTVIFRLTTFVVLLIDKSNNVWLPSSSASVLWAEPGCVCVCQSVLLWNRYCNLNYPGC